MIPSSARPNARFGAARCAAALLAAAASVLMAGCGGGGGSPNNPNPKPGPSSNSTVSGTITDIEGAPIVGATVQIGSVKTTSTQGGTYVLSPITVPGNLNSLVTTISASKTINGQQWTGQNTVEVLYNVANTPDVHVVLSNSANQGKLSGVVHDQTNAPLLNARVFVAPGPVTQSGSTAFTNLSSFTAYTQANGSYTIPALPAGQTYTVTASFAGHQNSAVSSVTVSANNTTTLNFTLDATTTSPQLPAVTNFAASCFTTPTTATRSVDGHNLQRAYAAIRDYVLSLHGLAGHRSADPAKITLHYAPRRDTPTGSLIETDLFWDYQQLNNLYGYEIDRSAVNSTSFQAIATLRDPLADRYADLDPALTPGTIYFYSVTRLDTINFPNNNTSSESQPSTIFQVSPLGPITTSSPIGAASASATPTFTWTAVAGTDDYTVLIYNRFPDYQSSTNGVSPVATQSVAASATSLTLSNALPSGTYYWTVLAAYAPPSSSPNVGSSFTVSPISSFTVP